MSSWKNLERKVAKFFNSERTPLSGGNSKITRSDSLHPNLFLEVKQRKKLAIWSLWRDTKKLADKEDKMPALIHHEKGKKGFLISVHSNDFSEFLHILADMYQEENNE